jgi:hypothetical protein
VASISKSICALLAKGSSIKSACLLCGIGERTYFDWQERGKGNEEPFARFFSAATRAREQHKARLIAVVIEAAHKDARHAEWLLERQFANEFVPYDRRPLPIEEKPSAHSTVTFRVRFRAETSSPPSSLTRLDEKAKSV